MLAPLLALVLAAPAGSAWCRPQEVESQSYERVVAEVRGQPITERDVRRYALLVEGPRGRPFHAWMSSMGGREDPPAAPLHLIRFVTGLRRGSADGPDPFVPRTGDRTLADVEFHLGGVATAADATSFDGTVEARHGQRRAAVASFASLGDAELAIRLVRRAMRGAPVPSTLEADREALERLGLAAAWVRGELPDAFERLRLGTWLDTLDLDGPLLRAVRDDDTEWPFTPPWEVAADETISFDDDPASHARLDKSLRWIREADGYRDELLWIVSAWRMLEEQGIEVPVDELWREFSWRSDAYDVYPSSWTALDRRDGPSDAVMRVVLALHTAYRRAAAERDWPEPLGLRDAGPTTRLLVDAAFFLDPLRPLSHELRERADDFVRGLPTDADARRAAFRAAEGDVVAALGSIDYLDLMPYEPPAWADATEIVRVACLTDRRWPQFFAADGFLGVNEAYDALLTASPGAVLGPWAFAWGHVVVEVLDRAEGPRPPRRRRSELSGAWSDEPTLPRDAWPMRGLHARTAAWMAEHVKLVD